MCDYTHAEKPRPDFLTLHTTFYDVSVAFNLFPKTGMRQFGASGTGGLREKMTHHRIGGHIGFEYVCLGAEGVWAVFGPPISLVGTVV